MTTMSRTWGTQPSEQQLPFSCDTFLTDYDDTYYRGITIHASSDNIYKWLCQMRKAPYSYDWIDNFGRKSPQYLIPSLHQLKTGQKMMVIFDIIDFEQNKQITLQVNNHLSKLMGDTVVSYVIIPNTPDSFRLLVKLIVKYPKGLTGKLLRLMLPMGDLIMMRR